MATAGKGASKKNEPATEKPKSKLLLIILLVVALLAAGGAAAWYFLVFKADAPALEASQASAPKPPVFLPMENFTVNLQADDDGERFLQTALTLQVANQEQIDVIKLYMPHVRSRLLMLLSSKKASDILNVNGKNQLAQEIIDTLKQPFTPGGPSVNVISVLFTSFVVQ